MKKILSIALVALLATSAVFAADFSGNAKINFGYDFASKAWGFTNSNASTININVDYTSGSAETKGEGEIYAGIKAAYGVNFKASNSEAKFVIDKNEISEAYVTNGVWSVSIKSAMGAADYANSAAIDGAPNKVTYAPVATAAPGFTVSYNDYKVGVGLAGVGSDVNWSVAASTPEYTLAEGLTANFAVAAADGVDVAASASVAYAGDITASVAADFGINTESKAYDFDVAAKAVIAPVTVDAYYNYGRNSSQLRQQLQSTYSQLQQLARTSSMLRPSQLKFQQQSKA